MSNSADCPTDSPDDRRRRREHDIRNLFHRFVAELGDREAIEAAARHIHSDPAWRVREEWIHDPNYTLFLAFWWNYKDRLADRANEGST